MTHAVSTSGYVLVEFVDIQEGISGEYDVDHPGDDIPLLRYDIYIHESGVKAYPHIPVEKLTDDDDPYYTPTNGSSFCSSVPTWTDAETLKEVAQLWAELLSEALFSGNFRQQAEALSHADPSLKMKAP